MGVRQQGYSIVDLLAVLGLSSTLAVIAVPPISSAVQRYELIGATEAVAQTIREARAIAVSRNVTVRVRFDCPGPGQYRIVEVVGDPAVDDAEDRCSPTAYPFPDPDPAVLPNADGAVLEVEGQAGFANAQDIEITSRGRVTPLMGCPTCVGAAPPAAVGVTNGKETRLFAISPAGQIHVASY